MAKKGILITGGSGLVGAYAVNMLLERGERPVVFDVALNERLLIGVGVDTSKVPLIRGDMVTRQIVSVSGGEQADVTLALIVWQQPNPLLLDEPTSHLEIEMREALAQSFVDFEGALVVVAYDR